MKVRTVAVAKLRASPGYIGKPPSDVVAYSEYGNVYKAFGAPVSADGLHWRNIELESGQSAWVAETSPDQEELIRLVSDQESDFERAFFFVMKWEGGAEMTNDPADPGGLTKYGIAQRSHPGLDVASLTEQQAMAIYRTEYWQGSGADALPWPLNLTHFDFAVNAGVGQAHATLAVSGCDFATYQSLRRSFYRGLNSSRYGGGWLSRVNDLERYALHPY